MNDWKVKKQENVYKNEWIEVYIDRIISPSGKETNYVYTNRTDKGGLVIVPFIEKDNSFLMVNQYRHPLGKNIWQFPGGGKQEGKTIEEVAKEELLSETGYEAKELIDMGEFYPESGISADVGRIFITLNLNKKFEKPKEDPLEVVMVQRFQLNEVEEMIKNGNIRDGWTLGAYTLFNIWLSRR